MVDYSTLPEDKMTSYPFSFDEKYTLRVDSSTLEEWPEAQDLVAERLAFAYKCVRAQKGLTTEAWAKACGRGENSASGKDGWLRHPEKMDPDVVKTTCVLFECTIDFLRCATPMPDHTTDVYGPDALAYQYGELSPDHKRLVTGLVRELWLQEHYKSQMELFRPYAFKNLL